MASPRLVCTHSGCGKEFFEDENEEGVCLFHSGGPVFHEGLKGWACCQKRVTDFSEFLAIPGCTTGKHTTEKPKQEIAEQPKAAPEVSLLSSDHNVEVYGKAPPQQQAAQAASSSLASQAARPSRPAQEPKEEEAVKEEDLHDPPELEVPLGKPCLRKGCGKKYDGNKEDPCVFHSGEPIFHEGSKGWSCCSRKVLEFEEFLKIKGCKTSTHRFSEPQKKKETLVQCRSDWYQTQTTVFLSIFAKNVDKEKTKISFEPFMAKVDVFLANGDRFQKNFVLFEQIDPEKSKVNFLSVKIELALLKANGISWAALEPMDNIKTWTSFGVQGRVGTIGGKDIVYSGDSPIVSKGNSN